MPELPEVETVKRGLEKVVPEQRIIDVQQNRPDLRVPFPDSFPDKITDRKINHLTRRGKYILFHLDDGQIIILHLGMSGRVFIFSANDTYEPQKHDHLVITVENGARIIYNDARRFGMVMLACTDTIETHKSFEKMGAEPLSNDFTAEELSEKLKSKKTPIKVALLDQRVVAGLGNIYVSEALFYAGIHPERPAHTITEDESQKLFIAIQDVLNKAIEAGGSTLKDYKHTDGEMGYFQHMFSVYDREGESCAKCSANKESCAIKKIVQAGRSTFFCENTQI